MDIFGKNGVNRPWTETVLKAGAESIGALRSRLDSWANFVTGLGTSRDKTTSTLPFVDSLLTPQMLEVLYHTDDIAARIVSAPADEAFRKPFEVVSKKAIKKSGMEKLLRSLGQPMEASETAAGREQLRKDTIQKIKDSSTIQQAERAAELTADLDNLGARVKFHESMVWGRLFGLGAILIGADDGRDPSEPLDVSKVKEVRYLTVLDKRDLTPWQWYADPKEPKFGDVAIYIMQPVGVFVGLPYQPLADNQIIYVHESRLVRFGGELTSKRERLRNQAADYSVLQKCFRALQLTNNNWQSVSALIADASQPVFKIKNLIKMISAAPDLLQQRMKVVDEMRSVLRAIMLDADGETFERVPSRFEGLPQLLDKTWERLASAARTPVSVLMGRQPGGLANNDNDQRNWYDQISSTQERMVKPPVEYTLRILASVREYEDPEEWTVVFPPLYQLTEKEIAERNFIQAQADQININTGMVRPEEAALSRFGTGKWSPETIIDVPLRQRLLQISLATAQAQAEADLENAQQPTPELPPVPGAVGANGAPSPERKVTTPDPRPPSVVES